MVAIGSPLDQCEETRNNQFEMDSQLFYFLNFIFAGIFLLWFFSGRKSGMRPTALNMKAKGQNQGAIIQADNTTRASNSRERQAQETHDYPVKYTPRERDVTGTRVFATEKVKAPPPKLLFMYNGHDWNAYEVLGVDPESTLPQITTKYQFLVKDADAGRREFLETAYKILLKRY